jgi:uncharacterized phage protein (TIGR01671 family)
MREIKFRAWDKVDKEMCGIAVMNYIEPNPFLEIYGLGVGRGHHKRRAFSDTELTQYTGLHDKNGKRIYEGDIVVATYGKWHEEPKGLTRICKVVYDDRTCSFRMAVNNSKVLVLFEDSRKKDIEIIGNIYENPELLEVT